MRSISSEWRIPAVLIDGEEAKEEGAPRKETASPTLITAKVDSRGEPTAQLPRLVEDASPRARWRRALDQIPPNLRGRLSNWQRPDSVQLQRMIVQAYRVAGFVILTAILLGLASYLTSQLFFMFDRSWIAPTVVSPTDERVIQVSATYAERAAQLDKLIADREALVAQLNDAKRTVEMDKEYEASFRLALKDDLNDRKSQLAAIRTLMTRYHQARSEIESANSMYAGMSKERLKQDKKAGLIENDQYMSGSYQLAQIANANLGLAEKEAQLGIQATTLARDTEAHEAVMPATKDVVGGLSYEMLKMKQDLSRAVLEQQRMADNAQALEKSIASMDRVIGRYEKIVKGMADSPLLLAAEKNSTVAFVPYDNLGNVAGDAPIYACRVGMFWCRRVGKVTTLLGAEVVQKHPNKNDMLRGQMAQMELTEPGAVQQKVLYVNRAPLLF